MSKGVRSNYITTKSYFLLRLWVLEKYHGNQKVFKSYMETGERPEKYKREYKFQ